MSKLQSGWESRVSARRLPTRWLTSWMQSAFNHYPSVSDNYKALRVVVAVNFLFQFSKRSLPIFSMQPGVQLLQGNGNDVVVVQMAEFWIARELKPNIVHELKVLGTEARRVWPEDVFPLAAIGCNHLHLHARLG